MKKKELLRKKSSLLRITTKNEDQITDQSNGLEAKISKEEIRITIMTDLRKMFLHPIAISLQGLTSHKRTITRTTEDQTINGLISHSIEMI